MVSCFLFDVLEVLSVRSRKFQGGKDVFYATLSCPDCRISIRVRDGLDIKEGFSGRVAGICQPSTLYFKDFNGQLHERVSLVPLEITDWIPAGPVRKQSFSALNEIRNTLK